MRTTLSGFPVGLLSGLCALAAALVLDAAPVWGSDQTARPMIGQVEQPAQKRGKANGAARAGVAVSYGKLPISFEANTGQTDGRVKFLPRGRGYRLFVADDEAVLSLRKPTSSSVQSSVVSSLSTTSSSRPAFPRTSALCLGAAGAPSH